MINPFVHLNLSAGARRITASHAFKRFSVYFKNRSSLLESDGQKYPTSPLFQVLIQKHKMISPAVVPPPVCTGFMSVYFPGKRAHSSTSLSQGRALRSKYSSPASLKFFSAHSTTEVTCGAGMAFKNASR